MGSDMTVSRVTQSARRPGSGGNANTGANGKAKLSHLRRPTDMAPESWQRQLRRQFGRTQRFKLENLGENDIFSEFRVTNPVAVEATGSPFAAPSSGQFLRLSRLRHERSRYLQAHRVRSGAPRAQARWQTGSGSRFSAAVQRNLSAIRQ